MKPRPPGSEGAIWTRRRARVAFFALLWTLGVLLVVGGALLGRPGLGGGAAAALAALRAGQVEPTDRVVVLGSHSLNEIAWPDTQPPVGGFNLTGRPGPQPPQACLDAHRRAAAAAEAAAARAAAAAARNGSSGAPSPAGPSRRRLLQAQQQQQQQQPGGKQGLPAVLVATIVRGLDSFSADRQGRPRNITDMLRFIASFDYPACRLSLAILTSEPPAFGPLAEAAAAAVRAGDLARAVVVLRPFTTGTERAPDRHAVSLQLGRRRALASARDFLLSTALGDEEGVLWLDADVQEAPPGLLAKAAGGGLDVVAPMVVGRGGELYDRNTWAGPTAWRPNCTEQAILAEAKGEPARMPEPLRSQFIHRWTFGSATLPTELKAKGEAVRVDAVGSAWLYVRAEVHRAGAVFTTEPVIGADWGHPGHDGQESEGVCWLARWLGFSCWLLPDEIVAHP